MAGAPMQNQPDSDRDWFEDFLKRWANPKRIYRGWWIVLVGFLLILFAALLLRETDFLLSMELFRLRPGSATFFVPFDFYLWQGVVVLLAPVVGLIADRFGPQSVVVPPLIALPISLGFTVFSDNTWFLYLAGVAFVAVLAGALHIVLTRAVTSWFRQHRGVVYAVLFAAPAVVPLFSKIGRFGLGRQFGWLYPYEPFAGAYAPEWTYYLPNLAFVVAILSIPLFFLLRRRPQGGESEGLFVKEGLRAMDAQASGGPPDNEHSLPLRSSLLDRSFLLLLAACASQATALLLLPVAKVRFVGSSNWILQLQLPDGFWTVLWPTWMGEGDLLAGVAALLLIGILTDRFGGRRVAIGTVILQLVCVVAMFTSIGGWTGVTISVVIGAGVGTFCVPIVVLLAEYWGTRHFGLMLGILAGAALGGHSLATKLLFSGLFGDPFLMAAFAVPELLLISVVLILLMKRPTVRSTKPAHGQS